jgi:Skp family chaperone for outer membrane proteins
MKKIAFIFSVFMVSASLLFAQQGPGMINMEVIIGNRPPAPNESRLMRIEEDKHPNIAKAMHDIEQSMRSLHAAPDDFGGHKAQAEADLKQAWISLRKALYFRLYEDRR